MDKYKEEPLDVTEKETWKPGTMLFPIPVVMATCGDIDDQHNIITIAWTGIVCTNPPMCYISVRPERFSYAMLEKHKEFGINLTSSDLAFATDWCGVKSGKDFDKFKEMKLTPFRGDHIKAPLIAEAPINLECKVTEIKPLGTHHMFLAEILAVHASKAHVSSTTGAFHLDRANPVCFSHGKYYQTGKFLGRFGFSVQKKKKKKRQTNRD